MSHKKAFWEPGFKKYDDRRTHGQRMKKAHRVSRELYKSEVFTPRAKPHPKYGYKKSNDAFRRRASRDNKRRQFTQAEMERYHQWRISGVSPKEARQRAVYDTTHKREYRRKQHKSEPRPDLLKFLFG